MEKEITIFIDDSGVLSKEEDIFCFSGFFCDRTKIKELHKDYVNTLFSVLNKNKYNMILKSEVKFSSLGKKAKDTIIFKFCKNELSYNSFYIAIKPKESAYFKEDVSLKNLIIYKHFLLQLLLTEIFGSI